MDGVKQARILRCKRCKRVVWYGENFGGPVDNMRRHCNAFDEPQELHNEFMEGPDSNCPLGHWMNLEPVGPVDSDEWKQWHREMRKEKERRRLKPAVRRSLNAIHNSDRLENIGREEALAVIAACDIFLPDWLINELASEMGIGDGNDQGREGGSERADKGQDTGST